MNSECFPAKRLLGAASPLRKVGLTQPANNAGESSMGASLRRKADHEHKGDEMTEHPTPRASKTFLRCK